MDNLTIRLARPDDIQNISTLLTELFSQEADFQPDPHKQQTAVAQIIDQPEHGHILVMTEQNNVIGIVSLLYLISTAEGGKVAILEDMMMAAPYRQQGLGKKLLNQAIDFARQQNCFRITLLTDSDNQPAQTFYQSAGFSFSAMLPMRLKLK